MTHAFIAIDWGTTNRRIYRIGPSGAVENTARDDRGVLNIPAGGFEKEVADIRSRFGNLPVVCAGMAGSNRGWVELPYAQCPAGIDGIARDIHWVEMGRTAIVPGVMLATATRCDVMRGEEVQFLGAVASGLVPSHAMLCQPGTHCKWARVADGRIDWFVTAMTGELYALLRQHSILASQLSNDAEAGPAFLAGVAASAQGGLMARLFEVRADAVSGRNGIGDPSSFVSGLLIGADVRDRIGPGEEVHLLADGALAALYISAIEAVGGKATQHDSHAAFVEGMKRIWSKMHDLG